MVGVPQVQCQHYIIPFPINPTHTNGKKEETCLHLFREEFGEARGHRRKRRRTGTKADDGPRREFLPHKERPIRGVGVRRHL